MTTARKIDLLSSEQMLLAAVVRGTLRRRRTAPPLAESQTVQGLVHKGYISIEGNRLRITEDGLGALECAEKR